MDRANIKGEKGANSFGYTVKGLFIFADFKTEASCRPDAFARSVYRVASVPVSQCANEHKRCYISSGDVQRMTSCLTAY